MADIRLIAWRRLLTVHAELVEDLDREMQEAHDLPLAWYEVLLYLHESETGVLRMSGLADTVLLSRSAATRLVDRMETAGLLERRPSPEDGRGTVVAATSAGRERFARAAPLHLSGIRRRFMDHITLEEGEQIAAALNRVLEAVED
jgi:DNA-binding MarR family transcriptional regulator